MTSTHTNAQAGPSTTPKSAMYASHIRSELVPALHEMEKVISQIDQEVAE